MATDDYQAAPREVRHKWPKLAAWLSAIIPGLGQVYNGQPRKGLWFLIFLAAIVGMGYAGHKYSKFEAVKLPEAILSPIGLVVIGILSFVLIWLLCVFDAYRVAVRRNEDMDAWGY